MTKFGKKSKLAAIIGLAIVAATVSTAGPAQAVVLVRGPGLCQLRLVEHDSHHLEQGKALLSSFEIPVSRDKSKRQDLK